MRKLNHTLLLKKIRLKFKASSDENKSLHVKEFLNKYSKKYKEAFEILKNYYEKENLKDIENFVKSTREQFNSVKAYRKLLEGKTFKKYIKEKFEPRKILKDIEKDAFLRSKNNSDFEKIDKLNEYFKSKSEEIIKFLDELEKIMSKLREVRNRNGKITKIQEKEYKELMNRFKVESSKAYCKLNIILSNATKPLYDLGKSQKAKLLDKALDRKDIIIPEVQKCRKFFGAQKVLEWINNTCGNVVSETIGVISPTQVKRITGMPVSIDSLRTLNQYFYQKPNLFESRDAMVEKEVFKIQKYYKELKKLIDDTYEKLKNINL